MTDLADIRARVEALEMERAITQRAVKVLLEYFEARDEAAFALALRMVLRGVVTDSKSTPNNHQIRSSLVRRVALAISGIEYGLERDEEAVNWASEARAAIREVAEWLRGHHPDGDPVAATVLEREARR
jgi:hypothetical protein